MLIWLEGVPSDFPPDLDQQVLEALIELGEAGYKARHVIACGRALAKHLASIGRLSPRARAYFFRLYGEYTQLGHVLAMSDYYVASLTAVVPHEVAGVWHVEIYEAFASAWMIRNFPNCVVSAKSRAGHGGSTVTLLRRLANDPNAMYLCLLDSDRDVVLGREGSTARGVRAAWVSSWRATLRVLECRELENALPLDAVARCLDHLEILPPKFEHLRCVHRDILDYACLKTGELLCRFHLIDTSHGGYERTTHALKQTSKAHPSRGECGGGCGECGCDIIPALGEGFLERFATWIQRNHISRALPESDDWSDEVQAIAELFAKKAIALPRRQ